MTDLFSIPAGNDDDEHWDTRAAIVAREAMRRSAGDGRTSIVQSRNTWIAASLLFAVGLALMVTSTKASAASSEAELTFVVAPGDDVGRALALPEQAPAIAALMADAQSRTGP